MPLNILLVDDEYVVLKGLEAMLLNQQELDLTITLAVDAIDAIQKLPVSNPDIIISDINMPEMDGLSMIEKIKEQNCHCKFIIISGYEKLEYFKKAIELHIVDYLLKPIDKVQLVKKLVEIHNDKNDRINFTLFKLKMFFLHGECAQDCSLSSNEITLAFPHPHFAFCIAMNTHSLFENNEIKKSLQQYFENIYCFSQGNQDFFMLNYTTRLKIEAIRHIWDLCTSNHTVGLAVAKNPLYINNFINQNASQIYLQALIDFLINLLPINEDLRQSTILQINSPQNTISMASKVLQNDCSLPLYIDTLYQSGHSLTDIHLQAFVEIFVCYFSIIGINMTEQNILQIYQQQSVQISNHQMLSSFLQDMLVNFWNSMPNQTNSSNQSEKIQMVCAYIKLHYNEDLSLDQLAEKVNLNPCYLSYIFKKEVGVTFLQYLHQNRISKACKLLKSNPDISMEAIAEQVGYRSATYFHKIFRSQLGISPKLWQQQNEN